MKQKAAEMADHDADTIAALFRKHLEEHHSIKTEQEFSGPEIKEHLAGQQTLIPISVFSNEKLSALETIVKYLKENEQLRNSEIAQMLGRTPASIWITYRNAKKKLPGPLQVRISEMSIPTELIASGKLSVLESVSLHLHNTYRISYRRIAELLKRDERTIWTVCARARKKLG